LAFQMKCDILFNVSVFPNGFIDFLALVPFPLEVFIILEHNVWYIAYVYIFRNSPQWARASTFTRFLYHTQRHTTVGRTPLDE
jgi:hypothetical protein